jgi:hypothetical protein
MALRAGNVFASVKPLRCDVWSSQGVRVTAQNLSASTADLAAAPLAVQVVKRRAA